MTENRTRPSFAPAVPATRGVALSVAFLAAAFVVLALAAAWTYLTRDLLSNALTTENRAHVERARMVFDAMRTRSQDNLRVQCRVLSEDPRLKATLAVEGIDEATVADILADLSKLRGGGVLMILSPEGRVFAQAGAEELRGLDLSTSSVVQKARTSNEAVVGSWVIGRSIMDLGAMPIRSDSALVAYLVIGKAVDRDMLAAVAASTGVSVALGIGSELVFTSTDDPALGGAFAAIMVDARHSRGRIEVGGQAYVTAFIELEQTSTRPYLLLARALEPSASNFELVEWLLFVPPVLVLLALLISRIRSKQLARMARSGGSQ